MTKNILTLFLACIYVFASAQVSSIKSSTEAKTLLTGCDDTKPPSIAATLCTNAFSKAWDRGFGGTGGEGISCMLNTTDKGYLLGGQSTSGANGDKSQVSQGNQDYWVIKIDVNGNKNWDKRFGGNDSDMLVSMITTPDGGYLLGGYSSSLANGDKSQPPQGNVDFWIVKIDANGNKNWDKRFGGNDSDILVSMTTTSDGGYLIGGHSTSEANGDKSQPSQGNADFWVIKIDADGNKSWDKRFGGNEDEVLSSMLNTSDGGYLLGGYSKSGVSGDKSQPSHSENEEYWIVKIDGNGNKSWDKCFGGTGNENLKSMLNTADGGYLLGGVSDSNASGDISQERYGILDYWVIKIDAEGNKGWNMRYGKNVLTILQSMLNTSDGGYLLGGFSRDITGFGDFWTVKINANGTEIWNKGFGGNSDESLFSMLNTSDGGYLLGGYSDSDVDGDKSQPSRGSSDYWILKTVPCPTIAITCANRNAYLIATGCIGTVIWSNGMSGSSTTITNPGTYTAVCNNGSCTSAPSNSLVIGGFPVTLSLSGTATSGIYKAIENITSSQNVLLTNNVTYQAGNSIVLQGTFEAATNSVFKAEIKACTD